jgi:hypothetical protein
MAKRRKPVDFPRVSVLSLSRADLVDFAEVVRAVGQLLADMDVYTASLGALVELLERRLVALCEDTDAQRPEDWPAEGCLDDDEETVDLSEELRPHAAGKKTEAPTGDG